MEFVYWRWITEISMMLGSYENATERTSNP